MTKAAGIVKGEIIKIATEGEYLANREKLMREELREISDKWLEKLRGKSIDDIRIYYEISRDVVKVMQNQDAYGDEAVNLLWDRHRMDAAALKYYKLVAQSVSQKLVDTIIAYNASADANYGLITVSHLQLLAGLPSEAKQLKCLRLIQQEKWSVRATKDYVDNVVGNGLRGPGQKKRIAAMFGKLAKAAKTVVDESEALDDEQFLEQLVSVDPKDVRTTLERIDTFRSALIDIAATVDSRLTLLDNTADRLSQKRTQAVARAQAEGREFQDRETKDKRKLTVAAAAGAAAKTDAPPAKKQQPAAAAAKSTKPSAKAKPSTKSSKPVKSGTPKRSVSPAASGGGAGRKRMLRKTSRSASSKA